MQLCVVEFSELREELEELEELSEAGLVICYARAHDLNTGTNP